MVTRCVTCWLLFSAVALHAQEVPLEYAVKANYLYKFAPFVEWPTTAFSSADSAFNICIFGEDPFGAVLDEAVKGQQVNRHPITVHRLSADANAADCHLLYVGRAQPRRLAEVLSGLKGKPVLTVTEDDQTVLGILRFVVTDGRVRFSIDTAAAMDNGLIISSKLLSLAIANRKVSP